MKTVNNRQNKIYQFGFRKIKDKSIQVKRNKRGRHLIDRRGFKK